MASEKSRSEIWDEWKSLVNIPAHELEAWLDTEESRSVGDSSNGESTGHKSGRRIVEILQTRKANLTDDQWDHMSTWLRSWVSSSATGLKGVPTRMSRKVPGDTF